MSFQNRLKSFVLRKGRLTSNQSRALSEHWDKYILDNDAELSNIWSRDSSILDIGFGSGETTAYLAKTNPEMLILGAEVYLSGIGSLLSKANEESLNNLKILHSDILPFLENKVSDNSFDLILMFYPDPWPKRKHHKRRLLQKDFIDLVNKKLKHNGIFYFKTDWVHYFDETEKLVNDDINWRILQKEDLKQYLVDLPKTSFEMKALQAKRKLNELILQKTY